MALMTRPAPDAPDPLEALLTREPLPTDTPAARRALQLGILEARREARREVETLLLLGRPLLVAIVGISFLHALHIVAAIKPAEVAALRMPDWVYHAASAALTLAIDAAALFAVAVSGATALAGLPRRREVGLWFFMLTTFLLNAAFVIRYAPSLAAETRQAILPGLEVLFAVLLPAMVPVGLAVVERAQARLRAARLRLLVEITTLEELARPVVKKPQNALGRVLGETVDRGFGGNTPAQGEEVSGGRPPAFSLPDLLAAVGTGEVRRADLLTRLGCSETTLDRLLAEGVAQGQIARAGRGTYRLPAEG